MCHNQKENYNQIGSILLIVYIELQENHQKNYQFIFIIIKNILKDIYYVEYTKI